MAVRPTGEMWQVSHDSLGIDEVMERLEALMPQLVVLEATGGVEMTLAGELAASGLHVAVVNPRQVRNFARATGKLAKTDALDAQVLAHFADRIQEYTGRTREQVLGALKYSIRQGGDGKWTWKYDRVIRERGRQDGPWSPEQLWECWRRIDCPTLVTRGDRSDIFADETLQRMGREIADCVTVTVTNAGHLVQGDNPPEFLLAARAHLERAEGG